MKERDVLLHQLENRGDRRGDAFPIPVEAIQFLGAITEAHFVTIRPGMVRGNHYHANRTELLVVTYYDGCRLAWQHHPEGSVEIRNFPAKGTVALGIPAAVAHAVKNVGEQDVHLASFSNRENDTGDGDTFRSVLLD